MSRVEGLGVISLLLYYAQTTSGCPSAVSRFTFNDFLRDSELLSQDDLQGTLELIQHLLAAGARQRERNNRGDPAGSSTFERFRQVVERALYNRRARTVLP